MIKILVFPKDRNPYQDLLYREMQNNSVEIKYLISPVSSHTIWLLFFLFPQIIYYRFRGYNIFHIHWFYSFYFPFFQNILGKLFFTLYILILFATLKLLYYKIIWTIHDPVSHEKRFINDIWIGQILSKIANGLIVLHNKSIIDIKNLGFTIKNVKVIPIGTYLKAHRNIKDNYMDYKKTFNIKRNEFVILFFGIIREYKGIPDLIKAIIEVNKQHKGIKLIIVGECFDKKLKQNIVSYVDNNSKLISIYTNRISDENIFPLFSIADIVALSFRYVTNSSSGVLSFSLGKPIIAPRIGSFREFPNNTGFYYPINRKNGLQNAIIKSVKLRRKLSTMGKFCSNYISKYSWSSISNQTVDFYKSVLND